MRVSALGVEGAAVEALRKEVEAVPNDNCVSFAMSDANETPLSKEMWSAVPSRRSRRGSAANGVDSLRTCAGPNVVV
jgi:hypothetical protein